MGFAFCTPSNVQYANILLHMQARTISRESFFFCSLQEVQADIYGEACVRLRTGPNQGGGEGAFALPPAPGAFN